MGTLNIYKIDNDKLQDLMQTLNQKMQQKGTQTIPEPIGETRENQPIRCELYYAQQENTVSLSWNWVLAAFGQESVRTNPLPKAVVLLKKENGSPITPQQQPCLRNALSCSQKFIKCS